jgi:xylan 1,4-beta-xylosidase
VSILVWHYHDDDVAGPAAAVTLELSNLPPPARESFELQHHRVDREHSNAYTAWQRLGSPLAPTRVQYAQLEAASRLATLAESPASVTAENGRVALRFTLPRQAVSLVELSW